MNDQMEVQHVPLTVKISHDEVVDEVEVFSLHQTTVEMVVSMHEATKNVMMAEESTEIDVMHSVSWKKKRICVEIELSMKEKNVMEVYTVLTVKK